MIHSQFIPVYQGVKITILIGGESVVGSHLKTGGQAPSLGSEVSRAFPGLATLIEMNMPRMAELPVSCPGYRCSRVVLKSFIHSFISCPECVGCPCHVLVTDVLELYSNHSFIHSFLAQNVWAARVMSWLQMF